MSFASFCIHSDHSPIGRGGSETFEHLADLSSFWIWDETDPYVIGKESDGVANKQNEWRKIKCLNT